MWEHEDSDPNDIDWPEGTTRWSIKVRTGQPAIAKVRTATEYFEAFIVRDEATRRWKVTKQYAQRMLIPKQMPNLKNQVKSHK